MKLFAKFLSVGALLAAAAPFASADTLNVFAPGSFGTAVPGATISATATTTFSTSTSPFIASYSEQVYVGGAAALCPTCLNFVYTLKNNGTGLDAIDSSAMITFGSFTTSEGYVVGTGVAPGSVSNNNGTVTFGFVAQGGLKSGLTSDQLVVLTNATNYGPGTFLFQDGSQANGPALVPSSATPEPSSLALLGTGIVGLSGLARRRFKR